MKKIIVLIVLVLASAKISSAEDNKLFNEKYDNIEYIQSFEYYMQVYDGVKRNNKNADEDELRKYTTCFIRKTIMGYYVMTDETHTEMMSDNERFSRKLVARNAHTLCKSKLGINNG